MIPVSEISRRLADRALSLCAELLPGGKQQGHEYHTGSLAGGDGHSLKVNLNGNHTGSWRDWSTDERGDLLDLIRLQKNMTAGEAIAHAKSILGIHDPAPVRPKKYAAPKPIETPEPTLEGLAWKFLTGKRKLLPATVKAFRVAVTEGRAIVFPSYSPQGELVNRSYRTIPKAGEKKKVWQDEGCAPCLFGWHVLPNTRTVLLSEGQIDCMTWHQWGIPSLSIPNGSGSTWIEYEWDNLEAFETILINFDMDGSGRENADKVIKRLGSHRCMVVTIDKGKDANEALQNGATAEDAQRWLQEAAAPKVSGLVCAVDLEARCLNWIRPKPRAFTLPAFDRSWKDGEGLYFRDGEVTLWTGAYGNGKSAFLNFFMINLMAVDTPVFIASMESPAESTLQRMCVAHYVMDGYWFNGVEFRKDSEVPFETALQSWLWAKGPMIMMADMVGYINRDALMEMMMFSFRKHGSRHFLIDSLMRVDDLEEDYPEQGKFVNRLQGFAKQTGTHVHLVAHPKKIERGLRPSGIDVKGASLLPNNVDNIVSVCRNHEKAEIMKEGRDLTPEEREMHDTEVTVDKQRFTGWLGSFYFKFNTRDFTFTACPKYQKPKPEKKSRRWEP